MSLLVALAEVAQLLQAGLFEALEAAVETATGPAGLLLIAAYSFLIAIVLPLPSEIVLAAPLDLGLSYTAKMGVIILVSATGKAAGSVVALKLGNEASEYGPVIRFLRRSRFDIVAVSERKTIAIAQQYGYIGLALALCVPGFPDTLSIYAFSVLEDDYVKFAAATFFGSAGRLVLWLTAWKGLVALVTLVPILP